MEKAKPFIKWVGGKSQLLAQLEGFFPEELKKGVIQQYGEPFLGGGALYFFLLEKYEIRHAYLSDVNRDLILTYKVIQKSPEALLDFLEPYQGRYDNTPIPKRKDLFLRIRSQFNQERFEINYGISE